MTIIKQINNPIHSNDRVYATDWISPTLNTMQWWNRQPFVKIPEATKKWYSEAFVGDSINLSNINSKTIRWRVGVAQTLDTQSEQYTLENDMRIRRLTPGECLALQWFPRDWCDILSDSQKYKCAWNAVTVNVIEDIATRLLFS